METLENVEPLQLGLDKPVLGVLNVALCKVSVVQSRCAVLAMQPCDKRRPTYNKPVAGDGA